MKKTDLAKNMGKKIEGQRRSANIPGRFADDSSRAVDRREQRKIDSAAGLVPFACKLPSDLVDLLRERSIEHPAGLNSLVAELLRKGLDLPSP
jgi:hypothetical protein